MSGRFTNLPDRLREGAECVGAGNGMELGEAMAVTATMRDAASKIEALELELKRERGDRRKVKAAN